VESPGFTIRYLAERPEFAEELARWSWDEWRSIYELRGQNFEHARRNYQERTNINAMPMALLAFNAADDLIGTVSLKYHDFDVRPKLAVWLGGLYVLREWRGRGVGSLLMTRAVEEARRLQLPSLHLWTAAAENFYTVLGWKKIESLNEHGKRIVVMKYALH
jgi:GNAT superfamily N-acetyltransferase